MGAGIDSASTRSTFVRNFGIKNTEIRRVGVGGTYRSFYKLSNFFVSCSRLLTKSMSEMPISSFLRLQVVLDKVLYCYSTYLIFTRVYLL